VAFVVRDAPSKEEAVALRRLERRRIPFVEGIGRLDVVVVVDEERAIAAANVTDDRRRTAVGAKSLCLDARAPRTLENEVGRVLDADPLRGDGRLSDQSLELVDIFVDMRANVDVELREASHQALEANVLTGDGRRSGLALAELAPRRVRRDLDPSLLAEVMDDTIDVLERFPAVDLRARDHVDAVTAVRRQGWTWPVGRPQCCHGEEESGEGQNDEHEDEEKDPEGAHIRRGLPSVLTLSGGPHEYGPACAPRGG